MTTGGFGVKQGTNLSKSKWLTGALALVLLILQAAPGLAEEEKKKNFIVGKWAFAKLSKAHELIGKGKYKGALEEMNSMMRKKRLNEHEKALMWQTFGYIYSSQERFPKAIEAFEKCLAMDALPDGAALDTQFNLGQLLMASRNFKKAVAVLTDWIGKVDKPSPETKYMISMALTQTREWKRALSYAKQAVASVKRPKETWLQLLMSIHFELKQNRSVAKILERLITMYPKKNYWKQLAAIYAEIKEEDKALATLQLCHMQGYLTTHGELMNLVSLLTHHGIPLEAARVMDKGMQDGIIKRNQQSLTILGDAWLRAREYKKGIGPLSAAAKMAKKGDLWLRVAQVHMEREEFKSAIKALQAAIDKGNLTNTGNAYILLGIANFRSGQYKKARTAFEKAAGYKGSKKASTTWLKALASRTKVQS
jgi:tetratricopeptide (TPR) repeat protein